MKCTRNNCKRACFYCVGAVLGLPMEHFVWEHTPYALTLLRLAGISV